MDYKESELKNLLLEIQLILIDSGAKGISQKEKVDNYKSGSKKIKECIKLLESLKDDVSKINVGENPNVGQQQNMSNILHMIDNSQIPGLDLQYLLKIVTTLKTTLTEFNNPPTIINNMEKDIIVDIYS